MTFSETVQVFDGAFAMGPIGSVVCFRMNQIRLTVSCGSIRLRGKTEATNKRACGTVSAGAPFVAASARGPGNDVP